MELVRIDAAAGLGEVGPAEPGFFLGGEGQFEAAAPGIAVHQKDPGAQPRGGLGEPDRRGGCAGPAAATDDAEDVPARLRARGTG